MILALLFAVAFYGTTNYYIGRKLFVWLQLVFPNINNQPAFWVIYILCAVTPLLSVVLSGLQLNGPAQQAAGFVGRLGDQWMGIYCASLVLSALIDLILLAGRLFRVVRATDAVRFSSGLLLILLVFGVCAYGNYHARQLKQIAYEVQIDKPLSDEGLTVVLISDLHLGYTNGAAQLARIVDEVNQLNADVVCVVGDLFNGSYYALAEPDRAAELMRGMQATYGVYGCLGNHDAGASFAEMEAFFEQGGIRLLNDEAVVIDERFVLAGRRDSTPIGNQGEARTGIAEQLAQLGADLPVIVMDHSPANIPEYGVEADLLLCGHTHRGQVWPGNLVTRSMYVVDYGHLRDNPQGPQVIVTSGVGTWGPPMRIGTDCEIVTVRIEAAREG